MQIVEIVLGREDFWAPIARPASLFAKRLECASLLALSCKPTDQSASKLAHSKRFARYAGYETYITGES